MAQWEVVREIKNLCRNNQMRDVFFDEIECEDPAGYVRSVLKGKDVEIAGGGSSDSVTIHAVCDGLIQKFVFTRLED